MSGPNIGVFLPTMSPVGDVPPDVVAAARLAEELGFESVWVIDQLVAGSQMAFHESTTVLAAVASATQRVKLGFGIMVLPLRPVAWVAKQVATLQHLSDDRVILGVGIGEDRHPGSWGAVGVSRRRRGRLTDAALSVLPDLIAGRSAAGEDGVDFRLLPGATVPPILVGGISPAALNRAAAAGGWFGLPLPPAEIARVRDTLAEIAAASGRSAPGITGFVMASISGDPTMPDRRAAVEAVADPAGMYGFPYEVADAMVMTGTVAEIAKELAALGEAGAERVTVTLVGDWHRQVELLAEAARELA
ncbi:LLM class flavin-dependent oxidoreductase [Mycolicibacterium fortuitum]|uniref:LLM class flavin-dependent oxidoreductase n=1 Tax=Mycolicibacterium fortuitum TaxID=1766 RepID=UPI001AEF74D9|nr:LLM class flavin-dependent oxidoreductase [Mycolicibacterium fortuitum]MBP3087248.1 LLM class flavin-dependent oxidoreductase [Mycolicibacterium fortuitum]